MILKSNISPPDLGRFGDPKHWRDKAEEARRKADDMTDDVAREIMERVAEDYDWPNTPNTRPSCNPIIRDGLSFLVFGMKRLHLAASAAEHPHVSDSDLEEPQRKRSAPSLSGTDQMSGASDWGSAAKGRLPAQ